MMSFPRFQVLLVVMLAEFLLLTPVLASAFVPRTVTISNATAMTTNGSPSPTPSNCCFVVQDTITENWWQEYATVTYYQTMNATYITTLVTPYIDTTVTHIVTNVKAINATLSSVNNVGYNPATMMINNAPQPVEVTGALSSFNGSQIVTAGVTVSSPAPFWVYSTVKIITVPAVTDKNGRVMCATTSIATSTMIATYEFDPPITTILSWARPGENTAPVGIFTISGVNSNAEAYFGGPSISLKVTTSFPAGGSTTVPAITEAFGPGTLPSTVSVFPIYTETVVFFNSAGSVNTPLDPTGIVITFPTPFIYLPSRTETNGAVDICEETGGNENYGYVPQTVLDYMTGIPAISSQYLGLANCLPGGPSILHILECAFAEPSTQVLASDLTTSTIITISGGGFFSSSSVAPTVSANPTLLQTPPETSPMVSFPPTNSSPSQRSSASPPPPPTLPLSSASLPPTQPPAKSINSTPTPIGSTALAGGSQSAPPGSPAQLGSVVPQPLSSSVPARPANSIPGNLASSIPPVLDDPSSEPPATPSLGPPPLLPSSGSVLVIPSSATIPVNPALPPVAGSTTTIGGSAFVIVPTVTIISLQGSITVSSGRTFIVISGPTTVPVNPQISIPGSTTIISGTPFIIVTAPTTIAVTTNTGPPVILPGSTATISGTPVVIISGPTTIPISSLSGLLSPISGVTTTISGTPVVVITAPTTVALSPATILALPGSTTTISGIPIVIISTPATIAIISGVTISGSTTVLGGSTTVFTTGAASGKTSVIGGTTAVVVSGTQSVTLSPSNATLTPVQVTGGASTLAGNMCGWLMASVGFLYAVLL